MKALSRKGQTGAAILIIVIAALIILYILFMPVEERRKLLEEEKEIEGIIVTKGRVLLSEQPGRLEFIAQREIEYPFPATTLALYTESARLKQIDSLYVSRGLLTKKIGRIAFTLERPELVESAILSFSVTDARGRLIIIINGQEIFNSKTIGTVSPIQIKDYLRKENVIEFMVSSPGIAFWRTNFYQLKDIVVVADILHKEQKESRHGFVFPAFQRANLEHATLRLIPYCLEEPGMLTIWLNDYEVYSAQPECDVPLYIRLSPFHFVDGENILKAEVEDGSYLLDQIKIDIKLRALTYPTYYFELSEEQYQAIKANQTTISLLMRFTEAVELKIGKIIINGHPLHLRQTERDYEKDIGQYIERGSNSIKIIPEKTIEIADLKVVLGGW